MYGIECAVSVGWEGNVTSAPLYVPVQSNFQSSTRLDKVVNVQGAQARRRKRNRTRKTQ